GDIFKILSKMRGAAWSSIRYTKDWFATLFLGVVNPLGSTGANFYLVNRIKNLPKIKTASSIIILILSVLTMNSIFFFIACAGAFLIYIKNTALFSAFIVACGFLALLNGIFLFIVLVSAKRPLLLKVLFFRLKYIVSKVIGIKEGSWLDLDEDSLEIHLHEFGVTSKIFEDESRRGGILSAVLRSLLMHLCQIGVLVTVFWAFGAHPGLMSIISIYSVLFLFTIISPTPQGIGVVEGFAQLAMVPFGIDKSLGLVVTLAYRAINLWIPVAIGFVVFRMNGVEVQVKTSVDQ
ncbi:flippase-like domain-containing protein, partial [Candidatus Dojkabacteria bacterium]|nr:flippase-like domain-containing protein [Candidatus Dojkabacteria bacterium]